MLTVHGFAPLAPLASPSPFCLKLEAWLRLVGIPYQTAAYNPMQAPKGKAPYVRLEDGTWLGDSSAIIAHLSRRPGRDLDADLTPDQRALSTLVQRTLEEHLYFALLHFRWVRDDGFAILRPSYFGYLPFPLRLFVPWMARRDVRRACHMQGLGRHDSEEIARRASDDLAALAWALGDKPWMLGDKPHVIDATAYAMLANLHFGPFNDPMQAAMRAHPNLVAYAERVHAQLWPAKEPR
jgi:glutathione S-transferase